jgi:hypothetical protein
MKLFHHHRSSFMLASALRTSNISSASISVQMIHSFKLKKLFILPRIQTNVQQSTETEIDWNQSHQKAPLQLDQRQLVRKRKIPRQL